MNPYHAIFKVQCLCKVLINCSLISKLPILPYFKYKPREPKWDQELGIQARSGGSNISPKRCQLKILIYFFSKNFEQFLWSLSLSFYQEEKKCLNENFKFGSIMLFDSIRDFNWIFMKLVVIWSVVSGLGLAGLVNLQVVIKISKNSISQSARSFLGKFCLRPLPTSAFC